MTSRQSFQDWSDGRLATLACLYEVSPPKPGNVHRGADFADVHFDDFMTSAVVLGHVIDQPACASVGAIVLEATRQTRQLTGSNTNLGIALLFAPLVLARRLSGASRTIQPQAVRSVLETLTAEDCRLVYEAIRLAQPGGLGEVAEADVRSAAPVDLIAAMRLAQQRDLIARQYANGFVDLLEFAVPQLEQALRKFRCRPDAIVFTHLILMAEFPDSLIGRKCGVPIAQQSAALAQRAVAAYDFQRSSAEQAEYHSRVQELDRWLRARGNERNPGTTADMIAAAVLVGLANGWLAA